MADQKLDNTLNLAMELTPEERSQTQDLDVGYEPIRKSWTVIVKHSGSLKPYESDLVKVNTLTGGYSIVSLPESLLSDFSNLPEVEYVEQPKRLYFNVNKGVTLSCVTPYHRENLTGKGVLVAVIDSGVDFRHPDFCTAAGESRILKLWDQTVPGNPPEGYTFGTEYSNEELNQAIRGEIFVPSQDVSGHGTAVLGILAGNGRASGGQYRGMAPDRPILAVKLGMPKEDDFPRTTELMTALDYAVKSAAALHMPLAINLSFGSTYGSHEGNSLVETFMNTLAEQGKVSICVGTGNEADSAGHASGKLKEAEAAEIPLAVGAKETSLSLQLWKSYSDEFDIELITPGGIRIPVVKDYNRGQEYYYEDTRILIYYGQPGPYSSAQEVYFEFLPTREFIQSGVWVIRLIPKKVVTGIYDLWLPSSQIRNRDTRFLYPSPDTTLTIPSAAARVIAVGAYNGITDAYAPFSGRGYTRETDRIRPDLVAPGVDITTTVPGGGYAPQTGTSFATPFATGAAALLMEWGIVNGNDPYLYGEKVRAYLIRGTRPLPGIRDYPDKRVGYGALCVRDSIPR